MNDDEELEKQDEQEQELDEKLLHTGKNMVNDATRRASKQVMNKFKDEAKKAFIDGAKKVGSVVFKNPKVLAVIAVIILVIILLIVLIAGIIYVIDNYNMNTIADKIGATIQDSIEIVGDENSGYSYQIKDGYLDTVRKELKEQKVDLNSLYLGPNYDYLQNYILAEMMMKYPKIGDDGTQGKIIVKRVLNVDSTEPDAETGDVGSEMTYVTPAKFEALKNQMSGDSKFTVYRTYNNFTDACKYTTDNRNSQRALDNERAIEAALNSYQNVFTIDENKNILVLKYNKHVDVKGIYRYKNDWEPPEWVGDQMSVEAKLGRALSEDDANYRKKLTIKQEGEPEEEIMKDDGSAKWVRYVTYDVEISKINYENMTSQYATPFNFLLSLLIVSESPEWVNSVANLSLNDGKIILTVFDLESTTIQQDEINRDYYHYWISGSGGTGGTSINYAASIDYLATRDEMIYRNINAQVTRVESWLYDKKDRYAYETTNNSSQEFIINDGKDSQTGDIPFDEIKRYEDGEGNSVGNSLKSIIKREVKTSETETKGFNKQVGESSEKINTDLFLGLWKNNTGKVERRYNEDGTENENAKYNPDGRYVSYKRPGKIAYQTVGMEFKQSRLNQMQPSVITWLFKLLEGREDLQRQERLMKYILYIYNNVDYGEILDSDMLALFKPGSFSSVSGIYGGSVQEKVWFAMKKLGFSEEAIAGAMGNIHYESGSFDPNAVEGGYDENTGGIGLCQWTNSDRGQEGRNTNLKKYAESKGTTWRDENTQINFLLTELTGEGDARGYAYFGFMDNAGYSFDLWKNATSVEEATRAFCYSFERPGSEYAISSLPRRISYANQYYNEFKGKTAPTSDSRIGTITLSGENAEKMAAMLSEALRIADDDRYQYSQANRYAEFYYDCSSFVQRLYKKFFDYDPGSTTFDINPKGQSYKVDLNNLQPGDVLWTGAPNYDHVAIYIGNGQYVHASCEEIGITVSPYSNSGYWFEAYRFIR